MAPELITEAVQGFSDFLLRYFVALAAVGALAMALIELWKKLRHSETRFHAQRLAEWFLSEPGATAQGMIPAYRDLIHLGIGVTPQQAAAAAQTLQGSGRLGGFLWVESRPEYALFAQPLERMVAHMQNVADAAINVPQEYPELFDFVTSGAAPADRTARREHVRQPPNPDNRFELVLRADTYARLQQAARHKIDAFQMYTDERWTNWNQLAANLVGAAVLCAALVWINHSRPLTDQLSILALLVFSAFGGILSPVAKDIVTALGKVRSGA